MIVFFVIKNEYNYEKKNAMRIILILFVMKRKRFPVIGNIGV